MYILYIIPPFLFFYFPSFIISIIFTIIFYSPSSIISLYFISFIFSLFFFLFSFSIHFFHYSHLHLLLLHSTLSPFFPGFLCSYVLLPSRRVHPCRVLWCHGHVAPSSFLLFHCACLLHHRHAQNTRPCFLVHSLWRPGECTLAVCCDVGQAHRYLKLRLLPSESNRANSDLLLQSPPLGQLLTYFH